MKRLLLLSLAATGLLARQSEDPAAVRRRLEALNARLAQINQQLQDLGQRRKGVLVDLQGIQLQRDRVRAQTESARLQRDETRTQADDLAKQQAAIQGELEQLRGELRKQVRWMQAEGPWGELGFLSSFDDFRQYLERGRMLAWWRLQERKRLDRIRALQAELAQKAEAMKALLAKLEGQQTQLIQYQAALQVQEDRLQAALEHLAEDEQSQKQAQAELQEEAIQLERLLNSLLGRKRPDAFLPRKHFEGLRGDLPEPVPGSLAESFGEHLHPKFHTKTVQTGVLVSAELGATVRAVADGKVVFAEAYQSYGPMVILDHGDGWYSLYTHLQSLQVSKGQVLDAGDTVGEVGDTVEGPRLGFEIRHLAKPEDPQKWLKRKYR
ncbi:MAG: peptidoglycan DD-metalloendopeptidase family protein [Acidobacteriota bacterium]|nr:peptidoglycan DD-metalloendopeptidase family protein [Acidobacteriota bacterium]